MKIFKLFFLFSIAAFVSWHWFGLLFLTNIVILFWLFNRLRDSKIFAKIGIPYLFFLSLNAAATFWLCESDLKDGIESISANALIMSLLFTISIGLKFSEMQFIFFWVFCEWLLARWDLAYPLLTFGNVPANQPYFIQWYSVAGVYGGSLWLLLTGLFLYKAVVKKQKSLILWLLLLPCAVSLFQYHFADIEKSGESEWVTSFNPDDEILRKNNYAKTKYFLHLLEIHKINSGMVLTPETSYTAEPNEFTQSGTALLFDGYLRQNGKVKFIIGTSLSNDTLHKFNALCLKTQNKTFFRVKKKYVPFSEFTPDFFTPVFGKTFFVKNKNDDTELIEKEIHTVPFICYEIFFSDFTAKNSANSDKILLISAENFIKDSKFGQRQYLNIIKLRAIENRRYVVKCSYKGISCVVSPKGDIVKYFTRNLQSEKIPLVKTQTFYQKICTLL